MEAQSGKTLLPDEQERRLDTIGDWVRLILHGFWVARVSTVSVALALVLFWQVPQAQDLFIELKGNFDVDGWRWVHLGVVHWLVFFLAVYFVWVVPIHFSARLAIQANILRMNVDSSRQYRAVTVGIPRVLSFACFLAVALGIWQALRNLPGPDLGRLAEMRQAAEYLVEFSPTSQTILDHARSHLSRVFWIAIILSVLSFLHLRRLGRSELVCNCDQRVPWLYQPLNALIEWASNPTRKVIARHYDKSPVPDYLNPEDHRRERNILVAILFCLMVVWLAAMLLVLFSTSFAHFYLPRAIMIPVLLGAMVPGLTFLGAMSHRTRHPWIIYMVAIWVIASVLTPGWHNIRHLPPEAAARGGQDRTPSRQLTIAQAVEHWIAANCPRPEDACPPPIIVAGQGGASRAAFFTGSVLAHLEEETRRETRLYRRFSQQLFAITTVSGSALGAAVFAAAVETRQEKGALPAPEQAAKTAWSCNWFGCHPSVAGRRTSEQRANTRAPGQRDNDLMDTVQLAIAGDFLTSVFHALAFHDLWRSPWAESRATTLERAWERQYQDVLTSKMPGLDRALSSYMPAAARWRPLLVFNGTAVEDGRRIITSPLVPSLTGNRDDRLFSDAYDFYELMCRPSRNVEGAQCPCNNVAFSAGVSAWLPSCDIRLSTAASNSARFPVISPPGNIVNQAGKVSWRIVDGGYFENFGLTTATEIADAIARNPSPKKLRPLIVQIVNDPEAFPQDCEKESDAAAVKDDAEAATRKPFSFLLDPIATVLNARTAHGYYATEYVNKWREIDRQNRHFAKVLVCPARQEGEKAYTGRAAQRAGYNDLSMSWWLSMPVQEYLHEQVRKDHNRKPIECIMRALDTREPFPGCDKAVIENKPLPQGLRNIQAR